MYPAGNLFIPAPHGRVEAILKEPRGARRRVAPIALEVGTRHAPVRYLIGIGTPVGIRERDYDFSFLSECRKPLLFVHGERDEFGSVADLRALAARLPTEAQVRVRIIPGAGHFFDEQLEELRRVVAGWAEEMLKQGRRQKAEG